MVSGQNNRCPVEEYWMCWKWNTKFLLKKPQQIYSSFWFSYVLCITILPDPKPQNRFYVFLFFGSVIKFCEFIFHNVFCICTFLSVFTATIQIWAIINFCLDSCSSLLIDLPAFNFPIFYSYTSNFISFCFSLMFLWLLKIFILFLSNIKSTDLSTIFV